MAHKVLQCIVILALLGATAILGGPRLADEETEALTGGGNCGGCPYTMDCFSGCGGPGATFSFCDGTVGDCTEDTGWFPCGAGRDCERLNTASGDC